MEKKEYAIGEVFCRDGKVYQCMEGESCEGCALGSGEHRCLELCCGPRLRTDSRSVIFTEVTKPVDGMLFRAENGRVYRLTKGDHWDKQCACDDDSSLSCHDIDLAVFKTPLLDWHWAPIEEDAPVDPPKPPEPPKRHIELGVVKVEGDEVTFRIVEQTHRRGEFSQQANTDEFKACNGIGLLSRSVPQWWSSASELYCRGENKEQDMCEITCTAGEFSRICEAISEYNSTDGKGCEPRWPHTGDKYFCIAAEGRVDRLTFDGGNFDRMIQDFGNFFRTKEEAKAALERVKQALKK